MTRLMKPELVTTGYATSVKITSTPATHAAIRSARRSQLRCFSMVSDLIVAIRRCLLMAGGALCFRNDSRCLFLPNVIWCFTLSSPEYSNEIKDGGKCVSTALSFSPTLWRQSPKFEGRADGFHPGLERLGRCVA